MSCSRTSQTVCPSLAKPQHDHIAIQPLNIREDILRHEQTIVMIIELNYGAAGFDNDVVKDSYVKRCETQIV